MDESVVEGGKDVSDTENELSLSDLGAERNGVFLLGCLDFLGGLEMTSNSQTRDPANSSRFRQSFLL